MTAQRTTLISLCIIALTLVFNPAESIELLQSGVKVKYPNALATLSLLIVFNAVSYGWRFVVEYKELEIEEITELSNNALESVKEFKGFQLDKGILTNIETYVSYVQDARGSGAQVGGIPAQLAIRDKFEVVKQIEEFKQWAKSSPTTQIPENLFGNIDALIRALQAVETDISQAYSVLTQIGDLDLKPETARAVRTLSERAAMLANNVEKQVEAVHRELVTKPSLGNLRDRIFDYWLPMGVALFAFMMIVFKLLPA